MTDPTTLPTYGAVRRSWVRSRERDYRAETNSYPIAEQRAAWSAEFDRWADAIRAAAWAEGAAQGRAQAPLANPYRKD